MIVDDHSSQKNSIKKEFKSGFNVEIMMILNIPVSINHSVLYSDKCEQTVSYIFIHTIHCSTIPPPFRTYSQSYNSNTFQIQLKYRAFYIILDDFQASKLEILSLMLFLKSLILSKCFVMSLNSYFRAMHNSI